MKLEEIKETLLRLINLVAFDVCVSDTAHWQSDANPLNRTLVCHLNSSIDKSLHPYLRKAIKSTLSKSFDCYAGRISFTPQLEIVVYFKRLRSPAFDPDLIPHEDE